VNRADRQGRARLARPTTGEQVADEVRLAIFEGRLAPGEPLREASLAEEFDTSRRSVQDALAVLAGEGLVRHERHRGAKVAELSRRDVEDLYRVRLSLESLAVRDCGDATGSVRAAVGQALEDLRAATDRGDPFSIVEYDVEFHRSVVGLLDSPRIDRFFATISTEMRFALTVLESVAREATVRPKEAFLEHEAIYDAILSGDSVRAEALVAEHVGVYRGRLFRIVHGAVDHAEAS
jgi:DNA-binding GntR family transcriptional regulator